MLNHADYACVDNYLDLFLYAGELHDKKWQDEIKAKLAELQRSRLGPAGQKEKNLKQQYRKVNRRILELYRLHGCDVRKVSDQFTKELFRLKQKRLDLGRKIDQLNCRNQQIFG
ncbi:MULTISPECIES: hypothetical protein [unclassified Sporolactobacillus]|uniref:hypothetical protein n=1 Tax=unclassified Sporolactobacillus TaxID=2628533 RepID=UPI0023677AFB|nr:hypothetical protein [Sporolactobacillus sp. CQH2019]MDD9147864.1 hypothetical protein [Sporolactobacillus sp. CQH2019]